MLRPRLHKSPIVVGLLLLLVAVLLEVPGRVVHGSTSNNLATGKTDVYTVFEHGWPWIYLRRATYWHYADDEVPPERQIRSAAGVQHWFDTRTDLPMWSVPWLSAENWWLWQWAYHDDTRKWTLNWPRLLLNVATVSSIVALVVAAWEYRRRRRPRVFSFGLVEMFVAFTLVGGALGWGIYMKREQQRERVFIGTVHSVWSPHSEECIAPLWMRSLLGDRLTPPFLWRITSAEIDRDDFTHHHLRHLQEISQLSYLTRISVHGDVKEYPSFPFVFLNSLIRLKELNLWWSGTVDDESALWYCVISEQDVVQLIQLDGLRKIYLDTKDVSPRLLGRLKAGLPNCEVDDVYEEW
jgi:hypothetical protein